MIRNATIVFGSLLAASAGAAFAQTTAADQEVLARVRAAYASIETLEASFRQVNDWSIHEDAATYRGHVYLAADGRARVEYDEPEGHLFVADGKWNWTYVPESGQVLKSPADPDGAPLSRLFLDVLAGRRVAGVSEVDGLVALELEPERDAGLAELTVYVDPVSGMGRRFRWRDLEGNSATYVFEESATNVELAPDLFVFEPPAGVEVVELNREERW